MIPADARDLARRDDHRVPGTASSPRPAPGSTAGQTPRPCLVLFTGLVAKLLGTDARDVARVLPEFEVQVVAVDRGALSTMGSVAHPSAEALADFVSGLRRMAPFLCCIGASAGGFGALRHGIACGADMVIGLSAATTFDRASMQWDLRVRDNRAILFRGEPDDARRNIRHFLDATGYDRPFHLFYPAEHAADVLQARNLASYPNCTLHPQAGESNHVMRQARLTSGTLEPQGLWTDIAAILRAALPAAARAEDAAPVTGPAALQAGAPGVAA